MEVNKRIIESNKEDPTVRVPESTSVIILRSHSKKSKGNSFQVTNTAYTSLDQLNYRERVISQQ